ncbi:MAG TPA: nucleoside deaminase [Tepidisphaeraceae bacterium]|jgi:tRNA(adenine34) deaminase
MTRVDRNPPAPDYEELMRLALAEAEIAEAAGDVPIGAIVWHLPTAKIIGRGHNTRERDCDPTGHAEIVALRAAALSLGHWRVTDSVLVVTLEPCAMCAGAIVNARVPELVYGCDDPKAGAVRTLYTLCEDKRLNHRARVIPGVLTDACAGMLRRFFRARRAATPTLPAGDAPTP